MSENTNKDHSSKSSSSSSAETVCNACGFESSYVPEGMLPCDRCRLVHYCSIECLQWDWKSGGHAKVCVDRRRDPNEIVDDDDNNIAVNTNNNNTNNNMDRNSMVRSNSKKNSLRRMPVEDDVSVVSMDVSHLFGKSSDDGGDDPAASLRIGRSLENRNYNNNNNNNKINKKIDDLVDLQPPAAAATTTFSNSNNNNNTTTISKPGSLSSFFEKGMAATTKEPRMQQQQQQQQIVYIEEEEYVEEEVIVEEEILEEEEPEEEEEEEEDLEGSFKMEDDEVAKDMNGSSLLMSIKEESNHDTEGPETEGSWRGRHSFVIRKQGALEQEFETVQEEEDGLIIGGDDSDFCIAQDDENIAEEIVVDDEDVTNEDDYEDEEDDDDNDYDHYDENDRELTDGVMDIQEVQIIQNNSKTGMTENDDDEMFGSENPFHEDDLPTQHEQQPTKAASNPMSRGLQNPVPNTDEFTNNQKDMMMQQETKQVTKAAVKESWNISSTFRLSDSDKAANKARNMTRLSVSLPNLGTGESGMLVEQPELERATSLASTIVAANREQTRKESPGPSSLLSFRQSYSCDFSTSGTDGGGSSSASLKAFRLAYDADDGSNDDYDDNDEGAVEDLAVSEEGGKDQEETKRNAANIQPQQQQKEEVTPSSTSSSYREAIKKSINTALRDYERIYGPEAAQAAFIKLTQGLVPTAPATTANDDGAAVMAKAAAAVAAADVGVVANPVQVISEIAATMEQEHAEKTLTSDSRRNTNAERDTSTVPQSTTSADATVPRCMKYRNSLVDQRGGEGAAAAAPGETVETSEPKRQRLAAIPVSSTETTLNQVPPFSDNATGPRYMKYRNSLVVQGTGAGSSVQTNEKQQVTTPKTSIKGPAEEQATSPQGPPKFSAVTTTDSTVPRYMKYRNSLGVERGSTGVSKEESPQVAALPSSRESAVEAARNEPAKSSTTADSAVPRYLKYRNSLGAQGEKGAAAAADFVEIKEKHGTTPLSSRDPSVEKANTTPVLNESPASSAVEDGTVPRYMKYRNSLDVQGAGGGIGETKAQEQGLVPSPKAQESHPREPDVAKADTKVRAEPSNSSVDADNAVPRYTKYRHSLVVQGGSGPSETGNSTNEVKQELAQTPSEQENDENFFDWHRAGEKADTAIRAVPSTSTESAVPRYMKYRNSLLQTSPSKNGKDDGTTTEHSTNAGTNGLKQTQSTVGNIPRKNSSWVTEANETVSATEEVQEPRYLRYRASLADGQKENGASGSNNRLESREDTAVELPLQSAETCTRTSPVQGESSPVPNTSSMPRYLQYRSSLTNGDQQINRTLSKPSTDEPPVALASSSISSENFESRETVAAAWTLTPFAEEKPTAVPTATATIVPTSSRSRYTSYRASLQGASSTTSEAPKVDNSTAVGVEGTQAIPQNNKITAAISAPEVQSSQPAPFSSRYMGYRTALTKNSPSDNAQILQSVSPSKNAQILQPGANSRNAEPDVSDRESVKAKPSSLHSNNTSIASSTPAVQSQQKGQRQEQQQPAFSRYMSYRTTLATQSPVDIGQSSLPDTQNLVSPAVSNQNGSVLGRSTIPNSSVIMPRPSPAVSQTPSLSSPRYMAYRTALSTSTPSNGSVAPLSVDRSMSSSVPDAKDAKSKAAAMDQDSLGAKPELRQKAVTAIAPGQVDNTAGVPQTLPIASSRYMAYRTNLITPASPGSKDPHPAELLWNRQHGETREKQLSGTDPAQVAAATSSAATPTAFASRYMKYRSSLAENTEPALRADDTEVAKASQGLGVTRGIASSTPRPISASPSTSDSNSFMSRYLSYRSSLGAATTVPLNEQVVNSQHNDDENIKVEQLVDKTREANTRIVYQPTGTSEKTSDPCSSSRYMSYRAGLSSPENLTRGKLDGTNPLDKKKLSDSNALVAAATVAAANASETLVLVEDRDQLTYMRYRSKLANDAQSSQGSGLGSKPVAVSLSSTNLNRTPRTRNVGTCENVGTSDTMQMSTYMRYRAGLANSASISTGDQSSVASVLRSEQNLGSFTSSTSVSPATNTTSNDGASRSPLMSSNQYTRYRNALAAGVSSNSSRDHAAAAGVSSNSPLDHNANNSRGQADTEQLSDASKMEMSSHNLGQEVAPLYMKYRHSLAGKKARSTGSDSGSTHQRDDHRDDPRALHVSSTSGSENLDPNSVDRCGESSSIAASNYMRYRTALAGGSFESIARKQGELDEKPKSSEGMHAQSGEGFSTDLSSLTLNSGLEPRRQDRSDVFEDANALDNEEARTDYSQSPDLSETSPNEAPGASLDDRGTAGSEVKSSILAIEATQPGIHGERRKETTKEDQEFDGAITAEIVPTHTPSDDDIESGERPTGVDSPESDDKYESSSQLSTNSLRMRTFTYFMLFLLIVGVPLLIGLAAALGGPVQLEVSREPSLSPTVNPTVNPTTEPAFATVSPTSYVRTRMPTMTPTVSTFSPTSISSPIVTYGAPTKIPAFPTSTAPPSTSSTTSISSAPTAEQTESSLTNTPSSIASTPTPTSDTEPSATPAIPTISPDNPSATPTLPPTFPGSLAPTSTPSLIQSIEPTLSQRTQLFDLLVAASFDGGLRLQSLGSPQNQAFEWLAASESLRTLDDARKIQRYAMATFYFSTEGDGWTNSVGWLSEQNECEWFSRASRNPVCDANGVIRVLDLGFNEVSGELPPEIGMLSSLNRVGLSGGTLSRIRGTIPTEIGLLSQLTSFDLFGNSVEGRIPTEFGNLRLVETLNLSFNSLSGTLPASLGAMTSLREMNLAINLLNGVLPSTLSRLVRLERLSLNDNRLSGGLPATIGELVMLKDLNLELNQFSAPLPSEMGLLTALESFTMYDNVVRGSLFTEIGRLTNMRTIILQGNTLDGRIPTEVGLMGNLRNVDLSSNNLTGPIPSTIGQLENLLTLQLQSNNLSGAIPSELGSLERATSIRLDENNLIGEVPEAICSTFSSTLPSFYVDCGGVSPEVSCPTDISCCSFCCEDGAGCSSTNRYV